MLIEADVTNLDVYLDSVNNKCEETFIDGVVDEVYQNHKIILRFIINNLNDLTPNNYIGKSIDLKIMGFNIDNKLLEKIQNSKINTIKYFLLYRDYVDFLKSRLRTFRDYEVIDIISDFYYKTSDYSYVEIRKYLIKKYQILTHTVDFDSNYIIIKLMENLLYKLNKKVLLR